MSLGCRRRPLHKIVQANCLVNESLFGTARCLLYNCCQIFPLLLHCRCSTVASGSRHSSASSSTPRRHLNSLYFSIFVLYVQLILGGMFRHHGMSWWPHVLHAVIVTFVLAWTAIRALSVYSHIEAVRRPAILMLSLLMAQLCLGFTAFVTRVAWGRDAAQPELPMVAATVAHVAVGALLLATTVVLAIEVWRHVPVAFAERVPQAQQKVSAA